MESNKDEALRCLRLAEKYLSIGEREKAEKFGRKAHKLFPSQEAEGKAKKLVKLPRISSNQSNFTIFLVDFLERASSTSGRSNLNSNEENSEPKVNGDVKHDKNNSSESSATSNGKDYTSEQVEAVKRF